MTESTTKRVTYHAKPPPTNKRNVIFAETLGLEGSIWLKLTLDWLGFKDILTQNVDVLLKQVNISSLRCILSLTISDVRLWISHFWTVISYPRFFLISHSIVFQAYIVNLFYKAYYYCYTRSQYWHSTRCTCEIPGVATDATPAIVRRLGYDSVFYIVIITLGAQNIVTFNNIARREIAF